MRFLKFPKTWIAAAVALFFLASCSSDDPEITDPLPTDPEVTVGQDFHVAFANGTGNPSGTLLQGVSDLTQGTVSSKIGYEMESSRTARIFVSSDRKTIYSLNYTVGTIEKLTYQGKDKYTRVSRMDASVPLGTKTVRFTKLNDQVGSVHYINAVAQYQDPNDSKSKYLGHKMTASIGMLNLENLEMEDGYNKAIDVKLDEDLALQGYYISRIDCPVLSGGKLYYGAAVSKFNASTGEADNTDKTFTLVMDYPSLTNVKAISTDHVQGSTNGYRTPTQHVNESGEILQLVSGMNVSTGGQEVHIAKIKNGKYDTSFNFNLSKLLNKPAKSNGFFYVGKGIAYIPYEDLTTEKTLVGVNPNGKETYSSMWKVARADLNKGTAIDLNVPEDLWLTQYQNGVVVDNKFYIALSPIGKVGNIYIFDINSESPEGVKGASLVGTGVEQYYIGIY